MFEWWEFGLEVAVSLVVNTELTWGKKKEKKKHDVF